MPAKTAAPALLEPSPDLLALLEKTYKDLHGR